MERPLNGIDLTDRGIQHLISLPKEVTRRDPASGYRQEGRQRRCELDLQSLDDEALLFKVFVRQNTEFIENFSLGLRCRTRHTGIGTITLIRYNGPHGETGLQPDGHFARPHIHRISWKEITSGSSQPQERLIEPTNRYGTFDQALVVFLGDIGVTNADLFFPDLQQLRFTI